MHFLFKRYPDIILAAAGIFLALIVILGFAFVLGSVITSLRVAIGPLPQNGNSATGFDLEGAKALHLKGLIQ